MSTLHFLPWLRRGLSANITDLDRGQTSFDRSAPLEVWVEVDGDRASSEVQLRPADHVTGLDLTQIARRYPAPDAVEVETGYWPVVEFVAADLPWALTPLAPHASGRLRPWLVLVCTPVADTAFAAGYWGEPTTITVDAALLPDLADSAGWAHVQSDVPPDDTAAKAGTSSVLSRLLAPMVLAPSTTYRACIVPAFAATSDTTFGPAWTPTSGPVTLQVFDTWTFTTGLASTFEELVNLLGPVPAEAALDLGMRTVDVTDLGAVDPWPDEEHVEVDYTGALIDTDLEPATLRGLKDEFNIAVTGLLDQGTVRVTLDPGDDDPVVTPPLYGAYARDTHTVPAPQPETWLRDLNLTIRYRMAAGVGADVVRRNQERYMAQAWDQAGAVSEAIRALNASRLQAEISRTWKARTDRLDDDQHAAVLRPQYTTVRTSANVAVRAVIASSGMPNGLFEPVLARITRPGSVVARTMARRIQRPRGGEPDAPPVNARSWLAAPLGDPERRSAISFGTVDLPLGALIESTRGATAAATRDATAESTREAATDARGRGRVAKRRARASASRRARPAVPRPGTDRPDIADLADLPNLDDLLDRPDLPDLPDLPDVPDFDLPDLADLAGLADRARNQIVPMVATRQRIEARIGGLTGHLQAIDWPDDEIPTRVKIGPTIDEALVWALIERSPDLLMPGVGSFPNNSVRLVETNPAFVAAFVGGANHAMTCELLWREYPADTGSTTFRRFWDRPAGEADVAAVADWPERHTLEQIAAGGGESVVLIARGDVFRLYPNLLILLESPAGVRQPPTFGGRIPPGTRFFAFDVESQEELLADHWKVILQEAPSEPRFGPDPDVAIDTTNSAHYAATTYQRPFSQAFRVADIVGEGDQ